MRLIIKMMTMIHVLCNKARAMRAAGRPNARPYKDALLARLTAYTDNRHSARVVEKPL